MRYLRSLTSYMLSAALIVSVSVDLGAAQEKTVKQRVSKEAKPAQKTVKQRVSKEAKPAQKTVKQRVSKEAKPAQKTVKQKVSKAPTPAKKTVRQKVSKKTAEVIGPKSSPKSSPKPKPAPTERADIQPQSTQNTELKTQTKREEKTPSMSRTKRRALRIRDTALTPEKGAWSIGLFNPLKIQVTSTWGLEVNPLVALLSAPHMKLWHQWWSEGSMTLTGLYGFTTPSWSLQEGLPFGLAGYLSPSCVVRESEPGRAPESCQRPGFDLAPLFGARLSGFTKRGVWTVELDVAAGGMISGERPAPLDAPIPVDLAYAPTTHQYRAHFGARYAHRVARSLSLQGGVDAYMTGQPDPEIAPERDPLTLSVSASLDWSITRHLTLTLGAILWRGDQRAFELVEDAEGFVKLEPATSLELYPTFDLLWRY